MYVHYPSPMVCRLTLLSRDGFLRPYARIIHPDAILGDYQRDPLCDGI